MELKYFFTSPERLFDRRDAFSVKIMFVKTVENHSGHFLENPPYNKSICGKGKNETVDRILRDACRGTEKSLQQGQSVLPEIIEQPRGMHEHPKELKERLSVLISEHQNVDEIVLTYGLCGYGTVGLISENTRLVLPRFDDCISQLLYRETEGRTCRSKIQAGHLYLTGWMDQRQKICTGAVQGDHGNLRRKCAGDLRCDLRRVSYHGCVDTGAHNIEENRKKQRRRYAVISR